MDRTYYAVEDGMLTHVIVSSPMPEEIKERFSGFFWTFYETPKVTAISMMNVSQNDQEIVDQMIADLVEEGYSEFPKREGEL